MSTASLPAYTAPSLNRTPSYSYEPHEYEQRIALADRLLPRPSGNFVKQSKNGHASLHLSAQEDNAVLPVYGSSGVVEGTVELSKTDSITSVEVKIEGRLKLNEIAEGGTSVAKLCLDTQVLWVKDQSNTSCPSCLHFSLTLPSTFTAEGKTYPLPPTFDVKLNGLPGFTANIDYSVSAIINKPNAGVVKSKAMGLIHGTMTVSTPFIYYPRTRPAFSLPYPLVLNTNGLLFTSDWSVHESAMVAKQHGGRDILTKLYIPASRIFCMSQPIPFHLTLHSTAVSLAAYLPLSPTANTLGRRKVTRLQLMRQSTVDVKNVVKAGAKREIWRVDCIGEATFNLMASAPSWIAYSGEIRLDESVKTPGFKAAGLSVKDCILFTMDPHDPLKCPFHDLRQVIAIRLTTNPWTPNGAGIGANHDRPSSLYSVPSSPEDGSNNSPVEGESRAAKANPFM